MLVIVSNKKIYQIELKLFKFITHWLIAYITHYNLIIDTFITIINETISLAKK